MQEQSDATLGYDRVVDTETGKVYRVEDGLMDSYDGTRLLTLGGSFAAVLSSRWREALSGNKGNTAQFVGSVGDAFSAILLLAMFVLLRSVTYC